MANQYLELKKKHQKELNEFPMFFAFDNKQFETGIATLGIALKDVKEKLCKIPCGGYIRKADTQAFKDMFSRHDQERQEAIKSDHTGDGYIYDMFCYELSNHEYCVTMDASDTFKALGLTLGDINKNPIMVKALERALKDQKQYM